MNLTNIKLCFEEDVRNRMLERRNYPHQERKEFTPFLCSPYMQRNGSIFGAIPYEPKLYADFVFNSSEDQR